MGFVFGMTGVENRRLVHWSDMLAVRPGCRDKGLGVRLKAYQRELLRPLGVETVYWTYDPLEAKNGHLNLNKLGAHVHEYVENMYGDTGSVLHQGLGTDRFIVAWDIESPRVEEALDGGDGESPDRLEIVAYSQTPIVNSRLSGGAPEPLTDYPYVTASVVRVEVPASIQSEKQAAPDRGERWRASTRRAFLHYLSRGYDVRTLYRDEAGRCFYLMDRD
jgi:predicted GNAT superfamily acetyltransferase